MRSARNKNHAVLLTIEHMVENDYHTPFVSCGRVSEARRLDSKKALRGAADSDDSHRVHAIGFKICMTTDCNFWSALLTLTWKRWYSVSLLSRGPRSPPVFWNDMTYKPCLQESAQGLDQERWSWCGLRCRNQGRNGARIFTTIIEHGKSGAWNGTSATASATAVVCSNNAEVLDGLLEALDAHGAVCLMPQDARKVLPAQKTWRSKT
ncbi:hypothetical protein EDB85DRAFT_1299687 [Lactarius pseudohatsudake]|nr:hypothetical protein EDB85DRAFT_1299687 [Lactarius pseudohatsudake]